MSAAHDDCEITFYEELGVASDATPQQIRDAFHLFARLLHPDQQTDPGLREIAEKQMRKLNRVYAVLSNPDSRRSYDEVLHAGSSQPIVLTPAPTLDRRRVIAGISWTAAIVFSAGLLLWLAYDITPGVQGRANDSALATTTLSSTASPGNAKTDPATPWQIYRLRSDLRAAVMERDAAISELNKLREASQNPTPENRTSQISPSGLSVPLNRFDAGSPQTLTELPTNPKPPVLPSPALPRTDRPVNRKLAGFWFYAKPPEGQTNKNQTLYLPEYIEANITEDGGLIHGHYRSRFVIADRAISPDVNFTFSGAANGPQSNCVWSGPAGARGELTLKLTSENSLRLDWIASELGSLGLGSGTAVLTRWIE